MPPLPPSLLDAQQQIAGHHHDHDHHHDDSDVSIRIDIDIDVSVSVDLDSHVWNNTPHHREFNRSLGRPHNPVIISLKPTSDQTQSGDHHPVAPAKQKPLQGHRTLKAIRQAAAAPPINATEAAAPAPTSTRTVLTTNHHATLSASALIGIFLGSLTGLILLLWGLSFLAARRRCRLLAQQPKSSACMKDKHPTTYYRGPDGDIFIHSSKSAGPPLSASPTSDSDATLTATRLGRFGTRRCRSHSRSRSRSHSRCRSRSRSHSRHRHGPGHGHCPRHPHCPGHGHDHDHDHHYDHEHDHEHNHGHWHWHDGHHHHGHHGHRHCMSQDADASSIPPVPPIPTRALSRLSTPAPEKTKAKDCTVTVTEIPITLGSNSSEAGVSTPPTPRTRIPSSATRIVNNHLWSPPSASTGHGDISPLQQNPFVLHVESEPEQQTIGTTALNSVDDDFDKRRLGNVF